MPTAGQLKPKIDALKKKIAAQGSGVELVRRRRLTKRLRRLQRARRTAAALEARHARRPAVKEGGEAESKPAAEAGA